MVKAFEVGDDFEPELCALCFYDALNTVHSCFMVPAGSKLTWSCSFTNLLYSGWATSQTHFRLSTKLQGAMLPL